MIEEETNSLITLSQDIAECRDSEKELREADQHAISEYERLLDRFAGLAQALGTARDLVTIFHALRDFVLVSTQCNGIFVSLYDQESKMRTAAYAWSEGEDVDLSELPPMPLSDSPHSRAVATGKIIITDDYQRAMVGQPLVNVRLDKDPRLPRSSLVVPMSMMGRIMGAVEVQSIKLAAYRQKHATAMRMAANLVAAAIENLQLLERERQSEERYRDLVENARDLIYTHDLSGRYTSLNKATEQITGYTREEALTMNIADTIAPEYLEKAHQMIARKVTGETLTVYDLELIAKDGHRVALEVNTRLIYKDGVPVGVQGIARDVSERKHLEAQLRQSQKLEAVGQLAGGVAHDFNNLLTVITGYSDILLRNLSPNDPLHTKVKEIKMAGDRAASLTHQLLAFSRKQVLQPKVLDLNAVVTDIDKMLRRLIGEHIELKATLGPALGQVSADPGQLEQVLVNLAVNARDAMPQGGKLIIETANAELGESHKNEPFAVRPGPYVMLAVSDTGTGMDAETKARVFEPFFTTKEMGKGTGLGLSTVYGIVKQSGGYIWAFSDPGKGTAFKIYLPRIDAQVEGLQASAVHARLPRGTETVLLVEDEEAVRRMTREILKLSGYQVLEACNGEKALAICKKHKKPLHLLVTDVVMPRMSGRELAERLSILRPEMRVLYISGYTEDAIVHHGVLVPGIAFLEKPFTPDALARKVREVLDRKEK